MIDATSSLFPTEIYFYNHAYEYILCKYVKPDVVSRLS